MSKHWFITGTSSGIGRELTEQALARGDRVVATVRKQAALDDLKAQYGDRLDIVLLELTDTQAIRRVVDQAVARLGRLDIVVSNAGYALFGAAEEVSDEQIRQQLDTNLVGSIQVIRAALPHLRKQGGGRILQVSSAGGQVAYPNFSLYHASKWAIEGFVESVRQEVAPFGIEFTLVEPGPTLTNFGAALVSPPAMAAYAGTPAHRVRDQVTSGEFAITGDAAKMASAIIASTDHSPAPVRLLMGREAFEHVRSALMMRIDALEAQKDIAFSTERIDTVAGG